MAHAYYCKYSKSTRVFLQRVEETYKNSITGKELMNPLMTFDCQPSVMTPPHPGSPLFLISSRLAALTELVELCRAFYFERTAPLFRLCQGLISAALTDLTAPAAGKHTRQQRALETKKRITDKGNMGALERIHLRRATQWLSGCCFACRETN